MYRVGESGRGAEVMGGGQRWVASRQGGGGVPCSPALKVRRLARFPSSSSSLPTLYPSSSEDI